MSDELLFLLIFMTCLNGLLVIGLAIDGIAERISRCKERKHRNGRRNR